MRKALSVLLSVLLAVSVAVSVAAPAYAADTNFPGVANALNLWDDVNYRDTQKVFTASDDELHGNGFNDKTSSVVNKTDDYWLLFDDINFRDRAMCVAPHSHYSRLANAGFNDKTSSVARGWSTPSACQGWPLIGITN
jgi:hypothetical protein